MADDAEEHGEKAIMNDDSWGLGYHGRNILTRVKIKAIYL
jgi:hypothetical protein